MKRQKKWKKKRKNNFKERSVSPTRTQKQLKKPGRGLRGQAIHRTMTGLKNNFPKGGRNISHKPSDKDRPALITVGLLKNPSCLNALLYFPNKLLLSLVLLLFSADHKLFHREERLGQNLDGYAGYAWLIHQLLPVIEKECGTLHRRGQGRRLTFKSTCTTQEYG